jgi:hypothetical protein
MREEKPGVRCSPKSGHVRYPIECRWRVCRKARASNAAKPSPTCASVICTPASYCSQKIGGEWERMKPPIVAPTNAALIPSPPAPHWSREAPPSKDGAFFLATHPDKMKRPRLLAGTFLTQSFRRYRFC